MKTLGVYIHIPFCKRKCAYCDFVSYPGCEARIDSYIGALLDEARLYEDVLFSRGVDTVFIGGGTPSLLGPEQFARLAEGLKARCRWNVAEFTVEANPETLDEDKLAAYAACGVNRLSIGLQTHDDAILARIGRRHSWATFLYAYENARREISNINIDTIFGLPGQTLDGYLETLRRVTALEPRHVSSYSLKLEPGTPLAARFSGADEELDRAMYHAGVGALAEAGLMQYETSNFARPGFECRHNLKYWTGEEYLGLGVAAHSYIREDGPRRFGNTENLEEYMRLVKEGGFPVSESQKLSIADEKTEFIMLRLRLMSGLCFEEYRNRFGADFQTEFASEIETVGKAGLIVRTIEKIRPTMKGFDLQNVLIGEIIKKI